MISAMKRVMEKLQDENESLKRSTTSAKVTGNIYSYKPALNPIRGHMHILKDLQIVFDYRKVWKLPMRRRQIIMNLLHH